MTRKCYFFSNSKFKAIGTVHRRIGRDRVEIVITEAKYHEFTQKFTKEQGLIVVHDEGQTRIGDFILAKLVDKNVSTIER